MERKKGLAKPFFPRTTFIDNNWTSKAVNTIEI